MSKNNYNKLQPGASWVPKKGVKLLEAQKKCQYEWTHCHTEKRSDNLTPSLRSMRNDAAIMNHHSKTICCYTHGY